MAKLNMAYLSSLKNRAKPSKKNRAKTEQNRAKKTEQKPSKTEQKKTSIVKFKKPSKTEQKNRAKTEQKKPSKTEQNCCCPHCRCHHLGYSVPLAHHHTIWCRSTFGPRGPGLSNPTSFLRPALPMAPTTDNNARDKRSVLRPNPATFLRDFALYMTTKYAIIRKRCLNYIACITH